LRERRAGVPRALEGSVWKPSSEPAKERAKAEDGDESEEDEPAGERGEPVPFMTQRRWARRSTF
jgi:hypothetical protein